MNLIHPLLRTIKFLADYILFCNWFIALAAAALVFETQLIATGNIYIDATLGVVFFSTLVIYNMHKLIAVFTNLNRQIGFRHTFIKNNFGLFLATGLASVTGLLISLIFCEIRTLLLFIPAALIAVAYSLPLIRSKYSGLKLREVPGMKIVFIGIVWVYVTVIVPVAANQLYLPLNSLLFIVMRRMLFISAIAITFDIRDLKIDKGEGISTLPVLWGEKKSKIFAMSLMGIFLCLLYFQFRVFDLGLHPHFELTIPLPTAAIITMILIYFSGEGRDEYYYSFLLDGMMILQFVSVWIYFRMFA